MVASARTSMLSSVYPRRKQPRVMVQPVSKVTTAPSASASISFTSHQVTTPQSHYLTASRRGSFTSRLLPTSHATMQGFNMGRYRPPDSDPRRDGFNQSHPLGKRARHLSTTGALTVRFELPFSVWCDACSGILIQGTRYNAAKRKVGVYYSTPIWAFVCKCRHCSNEFEVQTDPKNTQYIVTRGGKRKQEQWTPDEGDHTLGSYEIGQSSSDGAGASASAVPTDGFSQLERAETQRLAASSRTRRILELEDHATRRWADPDSVNSKLRSSFRREKKAAQEIEGRRNSERDALGWSHDSVLLLDDEAARANDDSQLDAWRRERARTGKASAPKGSPQSTTSGKTRSSSQSRGGSSSKTISKLNPTAQRLASTIIKGGNKNKTM